MQTKKIQFTIYEIVWQTGATETRQLNRVQYAALRRSKKWKSIVSITRVVEIDLSVKIR
jgi:hypothetical protein